MTKKIRWPDFVIVGIALILIFLSFFFIRSGKNAPGELIIYAGGNEYVYPLDSDGEYSVPGPLGESTIRISGGRASFARSPCPNQTCVLSAGIHRAGEWTACIPNDVLIVVNGKEDELDAVAY